MVHCYCSLFFSGGDKGGAEFLLAKRGSILLEGGGGGCLVAYFLLFLIFFSMLFTSLIILLELHVSCAANCLAYIIFCCNLGSIFFRLFYQLPFTSFFLKSSCFVILCGVRITALVMIFIIKL